MSDKNTDSSNFKYQDSGYYRQRIYELWNEYLSNTPDIENINNISKLKMGLLYIYNILFKNNINDKSNSILNYSPNNINISLIMDIFNIFYGLSLSCNVIPTMLNYSILTGINYNWFTDIRMGRTYQNHPEYRGTIEKCHKMCESAALDSAMNYNSVGSIFALKAAYGWTESPQTIQVIGSGINATPEQIAEKYGKQELPQLINQDIVDNN